MNLGLIFNPWGVNRKLRQAIASQSRMILNQSRVIGDVKAENRELKHKLSAYEGGTVAAGSALARHGSIVPEFVLAGFRRPGQGVRLIASRNLDGTDLTMTDMADPPPRWKLIAKLAQALTIDRPDYGSAIEEMSRIWRNWERDARQAAGELKPAPRALPHMPEGV